MAGKKKPTSTQRAASAAQAGINKRAQLRAQQQAEAKRRRRNRLIAAIAGVVAFALVIWGVIWLVNRARTPNTPTVTNSASQVIPPDSNSTDLSLAAWITVPTTATPASDALKVDVHTDYQCPFCKTVENTYAKLFEQLSDQGNIVLRQHMRAFLDGVGTAAQHDTNTSSTKAAVAAACVDVVDRNKFADYHNAIFLNQPDEGIGFTDQQLSTDFAMAAGLSGQTLTDFRACFTNQLTLGWVQSVEKNNKGSAANPDAPPAFLYGGNDKLCYVTDANGRTNRADCAATGAFQAGVLGTPDFFVNGVEFTVNDLFDTKTGAPLFTTAADLLTFLQQKAAS